MNDEKKPLFNRECMHCANFFSCKTGVERVGQLCNRYVERKKKDG